MPKEDVEVGLEEKDANNASIREAFQNAQKRLVDQFHLAKEKEVMEPITLLREGKQEDCFLFLQFEPDEEVLLSDFYIRIFEDEEKQKSVVWRKFSLQPPTNDELGKVTVLSDTVVVDSWQGYGIGKTLLSLQDEVVQLLRKLLPNTLKDEIISKIIDTSESGWTGRRFSELSDAGWAISPLGREATKIHLPE